jgi:hypothetical protein
LAWRRLTIIARLNNSRSCACTAQTRTSDNYIINAPLKSWTIVDYPLKVPYVPPPSIPSPQIPPTIMQTAKAHYTPVLSQPLPMQSPSMCCTQQTGNKKKQQGHCCNGLDAAPEMHLHAKCHLSRRRQILIRLLAGTVGLLVILLAFYAVHTCTGGGEGGGLFSGLAKRAVDSTSGNSGSFVKNKCKRFLPPSTFFEG